MGSQGVVFGAKMRENTSARCREDSRDAGITRASPVKTMLYMQHTATKSRLLRYSRRKLIVVLPESMWWAQFELISLKILF